MMGHSYVGNKLRGLSIDGDFGLRRVQNWRFLRTWLPRRCFISNQQLWLRKAYVGYHIITGPGEPIINYYWLSPEEFVVWQLKQ